MVDVFGVVGAEGDVDEVAAAGGRQVDAPSGARSGVPVECTALKGDHAVAGRRQTPSLVADVVEEGHVREGCVAVVDVDPAAVVFREVAAEDSVVDLRDAVVEEVDCAAAVGGCVVRERAAVDGQLGACLLYTSPSPRDQRGSRMPSSA